MSKKDFEALAAVLKAADMGDDGKEQKRRTLLAIKVSEVCEDANPRFDRTRFMLAVLS